MRSNFYLKINWFHFSSGGRVLFPVASPISRREQRKHSQAKDPQCPRRERGSFKPKRGQDFFRDCKGTGKVGYYWRKYDLRSNFCLKTNWFHFRSDGRVLFPVASPISRREQRKHSQAKDPHCPRRRDGQFQGQKRTGLLQRLP